MHPLRLAVAVSAISLAVPASAQAPLNANQQLARTIFQELVETNTSNMTSGTTVAAEAIAKRFRTAGFPDSDIFTGGVRADKFNVVLDLMAHLLKPAQQALTWDKGYFYPGPAVKNVPITMAPKASQDVIRDFGRAEYADWTAKRPHAQPLDAQAMVKAFHIWDTDVGAQKFK